MHRTIFKAAKKGLNEARMVNNEQNPKPTHVKNLLIVHGPCRPKHSPTPILINLTLHKKVHQNDTKHNLRLITLPKNLTKPFILQTETPSTVINLQGDSFISLIQKTEFIRHYS